VFPNTLALYYFPVLLVLSLIGCLVGTYATGPTDEKTLIAFYRNVRPWGFWGPVRRKVLALDPAFQENCGFSRDMFNVVVGTIWQTALVLLPMYVVLMNWRAVGIVAGVVVVTSAILKKSWYDLLGKEAEPIGPEPAREGLEPAV
jgi:hypothetical protein